jgi:hypothetical protein
LTLTSTYVTGGIPVTPELFGLHRMDGLTLDTVGGMLLVYDKTNAKVVAYVAAGSVTAPTFTGSALATHRHVLHFQTSAAANAVTAAANQLRTAAAAFDVAGVANSAGEGGVVDVTAGTPAGTNSVPVFSSTGAAELAGGTSLTTTVTYFTAVGV